MQSRKDTRFEKARLIGSRALQISMGAKPFVEFDENEDTIALTAENALIVHWIANGKVIQVGTTIDLDDYSDKIGSYVRAEAYGEGGVMYTQAFTLEYDGAPAAAEREFFVDLGSIATAICDIPVKFLLSILPLNFIATIFG